MDGKLKPTFWSKPEQGSVLPYDGEFPSIICWTCKKHIIMLWRKDRDKQEQIDDQLKQHEGHDFTLYA